MLAGEGVPIRTRGQTLWYSRYICTLGAHLSGLNTQYMICWLYWQGATATEHEELSNILMVEYGVDGGAVIMNLVIDNGFLTVKSPT